VHSTLVSLSTLQPAVVLLQFARSLSTAKIKDVRSPFDPSAVLSPLIRNAIIIAVVCIILGILSALRCLMKLGYRPPVLDVFLILGVSSMSSLVMCAMSRHENGRMLSIWNGINGSIMFRDHTMDDAMDRGILMMGSPIVLLFETKDLRGAPLPLQGRSKFQRLSMLLELMANICSALFHVYYVVTLLMALSRNYEHPYYALHLGYLVIFFSHRFLTTLPTWCSSVASVWKVICAAWTY